MNQDRASTITNSQLKEGYKQTEVGLIPEDWSVYRIQELIDQRTIVDHLDGNHGELYPKSHEFQSYGIPYITANDLENRFVSFQNCKFLSQDRASLFRKGIAKNNDVLFAHNATVGPVSLLSTNLEYVILSTTATYFRCDPQKLNNYFLLYLLQSSLFVKQYQPVMAQSTRNQVPITAQRKLFILLPPTKAEQESIACTLSDIDALIESLDRLLTKKRQIKQGAMQVLLTGEKRLANFSNEWESKKLGELVSPGKDRIDPKKDGIQEFCVELEHIESSTGVRLGSTITTEQSSLKSVFRVGDVLFGKLRAYLRKYWRADREGVCSTEIWVLSPKDYLISAAYLFQIIQTDKFIEIASSSYGTHMPRSDWNVVKNYELLLPPTLEEQIEIANILSDMDAEIDSIESKLTKTRQLKQGMMHELLTGKIRLVDPIQ
jgi:type I restriction enzyme, S subunit